MLWFSCLGCLFLQSSKHLAIVLDEFCFYLLHGMFASLASSSSQRGCTSHEIVDDLLRGVS